MTVFKSVAVATIAKQGLELLAEMPARLAMDQILENVPVWLKISLGAVALAALATTAALGRRLRGSRASERLQHTVVVVSSDGSVKRAKSLVPESSL